MQGIRNAGRNSDGNSAKRLSRRSRRAAAASQAQRRFARTAYREAVCVQRQPRPLANQTASVGSFSRRSRRSAAASQAQKRPAQTAYREAICVQSGARPLANQTASAGSFSRRSPLPRRLHLSPPGNAGVNLPADLLNAGRSAPRRNRAAIPTPTTPPRCGGYGVGDSRQSRPLANQTASAGSFSRRSRRSAAASQAQKRPAQAAYREAIRVQRQPRRPAQAVYREAICVQSLVRPVTSAPASV